MISGELYQLYLRNNYRPASLITTMLMGLNLFRRINTATMVHSSNLGLAGALCVILTSGDMLFLDVWAIRPPIYKNGVLKVARTVLLFYGDHRFYGERYFCSSYGQNWSRERVLDANCFRPMDRAYPT